MKLSKNILKDIVKECLIEILAEGLSASDSSVAEKRSSLKETIRRTRTTTNKRSKKNLSIPSLQSMEGPTRQEQAEKIKNLKLTKDPIMNEIFADTAATTLREQVSAENRKGHVTGRADAATRIVDAAPLADLFGENASNKWASLAFAPGLGNK